ncbi:unnamed protein product, partial [Polarella glacialis]
IFLYFRNSITKKNLHETHNAQNEMVQHVQRTIDNFGLYRDYKKRGMCVDGFESKVRHYNERAVTSKCISVNNHKFDQWITLALTLVWTQVGGMQVAAGRLALGEFLNYLIIFSALGGMWGRVYEILMGMQQCFASLEVVCMYMNLPTEDVPRMLRFNRNMQICRDLKVGIAKDVSWDDDLADHLPLQLMDFHFAFRSQGHIAAEIKHSTITMLQGGLYTFVGPPSSGKGTLLNLIGDVYLAHIEGFSMNCSAAGSGNLVLPPHLRTIHVSYEPMFFEDTLLANLTFGCAKSSNDGNLERVLDICKKLHISENILLTIEANELATEWLTVLSATEASLLHIARALIANPDVLVIHKPTLYLSNEMADVVYT